MSTPSSDFSFQPMKGLEAIGVDLDANDVLYNLVTKNSQLMMDEIPWRRSREKDPLFF